MAAAAKSRIAMDRPEEQFFRIVGVYEDDQTRESALHLCDGLVPKFWTEIDFDFSWWRFDYLGDSDLAGTAADAAAKADWVIFSAHGRRELPATVRAWIDSWSHRRANSAGALIALVGLETDSLKGMTPIHNYLREVAQQGGMDYFAHVQEAAAVRGDLSTDEIARRAGEVTLLLDGIIHRPTIPSRWGINE